MRKFKRIRATVGWHTQAKKKQNDRNVLTEHSGYGCCILMASRIMAEVQDLFFFLYIYINHSNQLPIVWLCDERGRQNPPCAPHIIESITSEHNQFCVWRDYLHVGSAGMNGAGMMVTTSAQQCCSCLPPFPHDVTLHIHYSCWMLDVSLTKVCVPMDHICTRMHLRQ